MRRLAQFVRLHLSRVCICLASVSRRSSCLASVCVCVRRSSCLASVCVCVRRSSCLASVSRLCASLSRLCASARVCVRLAQFMRLLASVCVWLSLCVCICLASVSRLCTSALVCVRLLMLRVPNARVCVRRSSCLACVCVCVRLRLCASACECLRELAHFMRLPASVALSRVCLRLLVGTGSFYASVVIQRVQRWGELAQVFAICLASYYPLAVFYNVLMLKYPSHHLIYVFYHPMPIMPLY